MAPPPEGFGSLNSWTVRGIVGTMFPLLIVLSILEMGSGYVLEALEATYLGNPTLLVMVPVMIGMGGNLGSILSSRISTRLHLGTMRFDPRDPVLLGNILAIIGLAATVFFLLGTATFVVGRLIGHPMSFLDLLAIALVSGLLLAGIVILLSITTAFLSYRHGFDPDDTTIPIVTNLCDILGVVIFSIVAIMIL